MATTQDEAGVRATEAVAFGEAAGTWVLVATVLGSAVAMITGTVVNVALPAIGSDLGADVAGRQWLVSGYLLTLSALILLGGALGDRYGRRRVFLIGVVWFAVTSLLCAVAPTLPLLIGARVLQGIGAALLTPGSLAIIQATFVPGDRARAIGAWSALGSIGAAIGPLLGGVLIDSLGWRWIFLINVPLAVIVVYAGVRHVPESRDPTVEGGPDVAGSLLSMVGLGGLTYAVIEAPVRGLASPIIVGMLMAGLAASVGFVVAERRERHPMLPLSIFSSRQFTSANVLCFIVYAALGGVFFLLVQQLQIVLGYSATEAGAASLPVTGLMLVLSERAGALAPTHRPQASADGRTGTDRPRDAPHDADLRRRRLHRHGAAGRRRLRTGALRDGRTGHGDRARRRRRASLRCRVGREQRREPGRAAARRRTAPRPGRTDGSGG